MTTIAEQQIAGPDTEVAERLFAFQAPYLCERSIKNGIVTSRADFDFVFTELKKYLWLASTYQPNLTMFSSRVDELWHQFILFTRRYHEFCDEFYGGYVHHLPDTSFLPRGQTKQAEFTAMYESAFGPLPSIWTERTFQTCGSTGGCSSDD